MGRNFEIARTKLGTAMLFGEEADEGHFPDEFVLYDMDERGWSRGTLPINDWEDVQRSLNQYLESGSWFREGDVIRYHEDPALRVVFDGKRFRPVQP